MSMENSTRNAPHSLLYSFSLSFYFAIRSWLSIRRKCIYIRMERSKNAKRNYNFSIISLGAKRCDVFYAFVRFCFCFCFCVNGHNLCRTRNIKPFEGYAHFKGFRWNEHYKNTRKYDGKFPTVIHKGACDSLKKSQAVTQLLTNRTPFTSIAGEFRAQHTNKMWNHLTIFALNNRKQIDGKIVNLWKKLSACHSCSIKWNERQQ